MKLNPTTSVLCFAQNARIPMILRICLCLLMCIGNKSFLLSANLKMVFFFNPALYFSYKILLCSDFNFTWTPSILSNPNYMPVFCCPSQHGFILCPWKATTKSNHLFSSMLRAWEWNRVVRCGLFYQFSSLHLLPQTKCDCGKNYKMARTCASIVISLTWKTCRLFCGNDADNFRIIPVPHFFKQIHLPDKYTKKSFSSQNESKIWFIIWYVYWTIDW